MALKPNFANPTLSPDGKHVLSGSGTVTLDKKPLFEGWCEAWRTNTTFLWNGDTRGVWQGSIDSAQFTQIDTRGAGVVAAGGDRYALCRIGTELQLSGQPPMKGRYFAPSVDDNGACAWLVDSGKGHQQIFVRRQGQKAALMAEGPFGEPRLRHNCLLFRKNEFIGGRWTGRTWGMRLGTDPKPILVSPTLNQGEAVPVKVPGRLLILAYDDTRLLLYPFKANPTKGWIVATGTTLNPDARILPNGKVRVVAWLRPGLLDVQVDLSKPMVTL